MHKNVRRRSLQADVSLSVLRGEGVLSWKAGFELSALSMEVVILASVVPRRMFFDSVTQSSQHESSQTHFMHNLPSTPRARPFYDFAIYFQNLDVSTFEALIGTNFKPAFLFVGILHREAPRRGCHMWFWSA